MSDAKTAHARQRAVGYMSRLLQMNPVYEGDEIIGARTAALGLVKKAQAPAADPVDQPRFERRKLLDELEGIRAEFWTLPIATLESKLSAIHGHGFADLEAAAARLRVVAAHRSQFPKLTEMRGFDSGFFASFKQVLTRSPRDVTVLKEQVLSSVRDRTHRKRGRGIVQLLQKQLPAVYELEADWLNSLYRQKAKSREIFASANTRADVTPSGSGANWWVIWFILLIVLRLAAALFRSN